MCRGCCVCFISITYYLTGNITCLNVFHHFLLLEAHELLHVHGTAVLLSCSNSSWLTRTTRVFPYAPDFHVLAIRLPCCVFTIQTTLVSGAAIKTSECLILGDLPLALAVGWVIPHPTASPIVKTKNIFFMLQVYEFISVK